MAAHPYERIATHYRDLISSGELKPGDQIPPVRTLAMEWVVNKATALKAMNMLREEGMVDIDGRRGTTVKAVNEKVVAIPLRQQNATLLGTEIITAQNVVAEALGVPPGCEVLVVRYAHSGGDDEPQEVPEVVSDGLGDSNPQT